MGLMTITMYGADWCGDCRRAKAWFDEREIAYTYVDLVDDPDETERVLERNNGVKKIPVIVFADDSHLVEPTNAELEAKMQALADADSADASAPAVVENTTLQRFELLRNGDVVSHADYRIDGDRLVVPHVETAAAHRGNGYAAELMDGMLALLRSSNRTIVPLCPFAAQHIRDNEQYHDLVS